MKRISALLLIGLMCSSVTASAGSHSDQPVLCGHLHVQVSNGSNDVCYLKAFNVNHGSVITYPAQSLMAGETKSFELDQTLLGPDVTLTYQCQDKTITLESQQNLCVLSAGAINNKVVKHSPGVNAHSTFNQGSYLFNTPGMASWMLVQE